MRRDPRDEEDGGARPDSSHSGTRPAGGEPRPPRRTSPDLGSQPTVMGIRITQTDIDLDAAQKASRARKESITVTRDARTFIELQPRDPSLGSGARNALANGLGAKPEQRLALICDTDSLKIAAAVLREADELDLDTQPYIVGPELAANEAFLRRLGAVLDEVDLSVLVTAPACPPPAELLACVLDTTRRVRRHAHLVGVTDAMMRQSMRADLGEMQRLGERLVAKMKPDSVISIGSPPRTALTVRTHGATRWHNNAGSLRDAGWCAMPGGEVYTSPLSVDGKLSPDGGVWLPTGEEIELPMRLELRFEGGVLVAAEGPGGDRLMEAARSVEGGARVGRVVFGTNLSLLTAIGARAQDLRMPSVHLVLGDPDGPRTGARYACPIEIPLAVRRPDVTVDGEPVMVRGRYARELI